MKNDIAIKSIAACDQLIQSMKDGDISAYRAGRIAILGLTRKKTSLLRLFMALRLLSEYEASYTEEGEEDTT